MLEKKLDIIEAITVSSVCCADHGSVFDSLVVSLDLLDSRHGTQQHM